MAVLKDATRVDKEIVSSDEEAELQTMAPEVGGAG
jgi:hypothetical protein